MFKKSRGILLVFLMVLPSLLMVSLFNTQQETSSTALSQRATVVDHIAGTRLSIFTNHVPIFITRTQDFVTQGWPGSGTELDPFLIYGLNITYDVGLIAINITNTDAYFKIVDCVVNQLTGGIATIYFENVSHATVEYSSITGDLNGIDLVNASNTYIDNVDASMTAGNAVSLARSNHVSVINCDFVIAGTAIDAQDSNYLTAETISFEGNAMNYALHLVNCNYSSVSGFTVDTANMFVNALQGHDLSISNSNGTNLYIGIRLHTMDSVQITMVKLSTSNDGIYVVSEVNNLMVENCQITSGTYVIAESDSNHTRITNNYFYASYAGISFGGITDLEIVDNTFDTITTGHAISIGNGLDTIIDSNNVSSVSGGNAIRLDTVSNVSITSNTINDVTDDIIYATSVNKTTVTHNTLSQGDVGLEVNPGDQWDILYNTIFDSDYAIVVQNSNAMNISYNTIHDTAIDGIYGSANDDFVIVGNDVTDSHSIGINVVTASYSFIDGNTVHRGFGGISLSQSPNGTVQFNIVADQSMYGIRVHSSGNAKILNNSVSFVGAGINIVSSPKSEFVGNAMTDCGFYLQSEVPASAYVYTMIENSIGGLPIYYGFNKSGQSIDGAKYGQVILINSTNILVQNGSFVRNTQGVIGIYCQFLTIEDVDITEPQMAIFLSRSNNVTISKLIAVGSTDAHGVYTEWSSNVTVRNSEFSGFSTYEGIHFGMGTGFTSSNVSFVESHTGINTYNALNLTVADSHFQDLPWYGIQASGTSDYGQVRSCEFVNVTRGIILLDLSNEWIIDGSTFLYSSVYGAGSSSSSSDHVNITNSYFEGNEYGVYAQYADYWTIIGNTFRWNQKYGVWLEGMSSPVIYENTFVGNKIANGYDHNTHYWDNDVDTGNAWDDYSGSGTYNIADASSQDRYPSRYSVTTPIISTPLDCAYPEGTEEYMLSWNAADDYLVNWEITVDGSAWASGAWDYNNVSVDIGGLAYGDHTVIVTIYDLDMNNATDTVLVHVYDGTAPVIEGVSTMTAFVGAPDQFVRWNVTDAHPTNFSIYVDDILSVELDWTTGQISFDVSSLAVGNHKVLLTIRDIDLNEASHTVTVHMIEDSDNPTINSPEDMTIVYATSGNNVIWTPYDLYPDRYEVQLNGTTLTSGDWNGEKIVVNLDGLDIGTYEFTVRVYDGADNVASDSVLVTVIPPSGMHSNATGTTPPPSIDPTILLLIGGAVGAVIVVAALYVYRKRRDS